MASAGVYHYTKHDSGCLSPPQLLYSAPWVFKIICGKKKKKKELQHGLIECNWGRFQAAPLIFTLYKPRSRPRRH